MKIKISFLKTLAFAFLLTLQGCYHYRISTSKFDPGTSYVKHTAHSLGWGLAQKDVRATDCDSLHLKYLDEVKVTSNLGYSLITVLTLGFWSPVTIEYKCQKPCPREGGN